MHYMPHGHPHTHADDEAVTPGLYEDALPLARDYRARAFTVGIGGPVGSGKTALLLALCRLLRDRYNIAVVTNDIFTKEDGEFLVPTSGAARPSGLPRSRPEAARTRRCATTSARISMRWDS